MVSLAAALALPMDFPQRDAVVFLAFTAILATLVLQGTTLEWLIRRLHAEVPAHAGGIDPEEAKAHHLSARAALDEIERRLTLNPLEGAIAADLVPGSATAPAICTRAAGDRGAVAAERAARQRLRLDSPEAARGRLIDSTARAGCVRRGWPGWNWSSTLRIARPPGAGRRADRNGTARGGAAPARADWLGRLLRAELTPCRGRAAVQPVSSG
ncbi:hypothetical protein [Siccirubricoccus sp. G192]|uniref:hypothetical protein n=1 Tax=Siccirubricoccus sp. G192 TaxID=2849651 RepID=UPI00281238C1|nr:hypothetical protein [Siccirubricoccus sp. G192]